ncbi:MAG TPA: TonB-dependent receptor plug domain-containing protein, partial [Lentimicrobium sp.]|nr:TonB-dependent receptor plug domain-containing protein [Lentimicrobium sp.]
MKYSVVTGLLFFVSLTYVGAQQPVADTVNLKAFEVTGKAPSVVSRAASPVQRMEAGVLKELPGTSAAEALRHFAGVTIKDYGGLGGLKTMVVRSMGANHTGIFVDGVPLSDAASGQIDLGKIPLENLETIELSVGQVSPLCQSARAQASASVVEFFSQAPNFSDTKLQLRAGLKTGSFGVINPFASAGFKLSSHTLAGVTADYNHTRGDYPFVLKN